MKVLFLRPAQCEVDDAHEWYDSQSHGVGSLFLDDLDRTIRRMAAYPHVGREIGQGLRRCILSRFPCGIIYGIDSEAIIVVAVAHLHREPHYWTDRLPD